MNSENKNSLCFFTTLAEKNTSDLKEMANSTPTKRLQNITCLIMNMYRMELNKPIKNLRLNFSE